jgi:hypothetical protein
VRHERHGVWRCISRFTSLLLAFLFIYGQRSQSNATLLEMRAVLFGSLRIGDVDTSNCQTVEPKITSGATEWPPHEKQQQPLLLRSPRRTMHLVTAAYRAFASERRTRMYYSKHNLFNVRLARRPISAHCKSKGRTGLIPIFVQQPSWAIKITPVIFIILRRTTEALAARPDRAWNWDSQQTIRYRLDRELTS